MSITTCDHNLCFLLMIIRASPLSILNNRNPFALPMDPGTIPINAIRTATKITEVARLYKDYKDKYTTYCEFRIILITMITNKFPQKYTTTLKHLITKFCQYGPFTLLNYIYNEYVTTTSSYIADIFDHITVRSNPPTPISNLFQQINGGKEFAAEENEVINDRQLIFLYYNNVHASLIFSETLKKWRKKPDIDKTYATFVPFTTQQ